MNSQSYFGQAHDEIRYGLATNDIPGLRRSQIGALHAVNAHFTLQDRPAVVVLPTGAGKTAVLMLVPYMLCASRVLIITPSRFVREQIASDFRILRTLKYVRALPNELTPPQLFENKKIIKTDEEWNALRPYDVVVSTPNSCSPAYERIPTPPNDLFDLILIDEAHHSPAPTWNALIDAFPKSYCILFTATPFRRDGQEIKGKYVYTYPIQRAFEDGIYGEMSYVPVHSSSDIAPDVALALATEQTFREDIDGGLLHSIMVRVDSRTRADALSEIYKQHTSLKLEVVHSKKSPKAVEAVIQRLRMRDLDGVICVDMLGEGFDLPNLKIAALHAPHRSLAVTLQFFGRFARVSGDRLGNARFLAVQDEIDESMNELFTESEAWGRKIRMLGQAKIGEEIAIREVLDEFRVNERVRNEAVLEELSLYSFQLFNHVKVFQIHGDVDLQLIPELQGFVTEKVWTSELQSTIVFLVREEVRPKWTSVTGLDRMEHHLFVVYFDKKTELLFICATCREEPLYKEIATIYIKGYSQPISLSKINRVLRSFSNLELFNVGMRNRATGTVTETYRQLAGAAVHGAIQKADGDLYHRGHIFGKGDTADGRTTIGISSLSKVWRMEYTKIPELIRWCQSLAQDIANPTSFITGIALDHLDAGHDITELPPMVVLAADWQDEFYQNPPIIEYLDEMGSKHHAPILDTDLIIVRDAGNTGQIVIKVRIVDVFTLFTFAVTPRPTLQYLNDMQPRWNVIRGTRSLDLVDYLSDYQLRFHLADGSLLEGCQLFEAPAEDTIGYNRELMKAIDWEGMGVDIRKEYGHCAPGFQSIHAWLNAELLNSSSAIVFYDHRTGECADYLTVAEDKNGQPTVALYHCKKAGGDASGERVDDLYEVCGQAIKSVQWRSKKRLLRQVEERLKTGSLFYKGDLTDFKQLIDAEPRYELPLQVYIVQPGISQSKLSDKLGRLLAATNRAVIAHGCGPLRVICSA